jgi:TPR repeat protein
MDIKDSDTRTYQFLVTYEDRDRLEVAQIVDDSMHTGLFVRGLVAVLIVLCCCSPYIKIAFAPQLKGGFFLLIFLFWGFRWSIDPIYWNLTRRFWLPVGSTLNTGISKKGLTTVTGNRPPLTTSWDNLESVAQRTAGIVIRFRIGGSSFLQQSPWQQRVRWLMGTPYIWLPTRCFRNLDVQQEVFDFARKFVSDGSADLPSFYSKPYASSLVFILGMGIGLARPGLDLEPKDPSIEYIRAVQYWNHDRAKATALFLMSAEQGDAKAQNQMGTQYQYGDEVSKDETKAAFWYRKAAEQGNAMAQTNLGALYLTGKGVEKDETQAEMWYRKAADQGLAAAQFRLGSFYEVAQNRPQDYSQAAVWFQKAVNQGSNEAQNNLGLLYQNGTGVLQNDAKAADLFADSAAGGNYAGQYNLAMAYENGRGVMKDHALALQWMHKSAARGNQMAIDALHNFDRDSSIVPCPITASCAFSLPLPDHDPLSIH